MTSSPSQLRAVVSNAGPSGGRGGQGCRGGEKDPAFGNSRSLDVRLAVRGAAPASLGGPARGREQGRGLAGTQDWPPQAQSSRLLTPQVRSAVKKKWHRWQDHHSLRVPRARAVSIPTSPTRISFHSIKQTAAV